MPYHCFSGNCSSSNLGGYLQYPGSFCGSSHPSNLACTTGFGSSSSYQMGSPVYSGCQETCTKPVRFQSSCGMPVSSQSACCRPRPSTTCGPCQPGYTGFGSSSSCSLGYGSGSSYSGGCGPSSFKPCGGSGFPSMNCGPGFGRPSYQPTKPGQSSCFRPSCGSGF